MRRASERAAPRCTARSSRAATPAGPVRARNGLRRRASYESWPRPPIRTRGWPGAASRICGRAASQVEADVAPRQTARQNAAFFTFMRERRPFVLFKAAVSLDGRIAAAAGTRTQISGVEAQRDTQRLRSEMDGIAVGSGTVLADDPVLTVREVYRERPFTRVIFDRRLRTPPTARLFTTRDDGPIVVLTDAARLSDSRRAVEDLRHAGARIEALEDTSIAAGMARLGELGVTSAAARGRGGPERRGLGCRYDRSRAAVRRAHGPWTRGRAAARRAPSGNRRPVRSPCRTVRRRRPDRRRCSPD